LNANIKCPPLTQQIQLITIVVEVVAAVVVIDVNFAVDVAVAVVVVVANVSQHYILMRTKFFNIAKSYSQSF
jgi:hypothetical protein